MYKNESNIEILVVEDNLGDYILIEEYIAEMFFSSKITHKKNFKDTQTHLLSGANTYDLILLDVTLPDKQGVDLINELLVIADRCPILILTGYESLEFSVKSLQLGVSDYLLKDELSAYTLYKSIIFSIERKNHLKKIEDSEKKYSDMFHLNPIPLWVFELETYKILNVNSAAIQNYGYCEEEFLQMSMLSIFPENELEIILSLSESGNRSHKFEKENFETIKKSGELIYGKIEINEIIFDGKKCCILLVNYISELLRTQNSLKIANQNIIEVEEKEKERFAAEIHDGLAQNLVAAQLIFSMLIENHPELNDNPHVHILSKTISNTIKECSSLVHDVRPKLLIDFGFQAVFEQLVEKAELAGNLSIIQKINLQLEDHFNYPELLHFYRLIQELFNNTIKYAKATSIDISIVRISDEIHLYFSDNGIGISDLALNQSSSFLSLKKRVQILNGDFKVESLLGNGTSFNITIPISKD